MPQVFSYIKLNECHPDNIGKLSNDIKENNYNELSEISRVISGVANNTENRRDQIIHFSDTETKDISTKKSVLKYLLIGGTILAGVGALGTLGAGVGYYYMTGRQNTGHRSENMPPSHFSEVPASVNRVLWEAGEGALTTAGYSLRSEVNSTATPETSLSPYSYYENMYGSTATQDQTRQLASASITNKPDAVSEKNNIIPGNLATTAEEPDITTKSPLALAYMTTKQAYAPVISEKKIKWYNHYKIRSELYNSLMGDRESPKPLGPIFHDKISTFCHSKSIKPVIEQAWAGDSKQKCALLNSMSDTIEQFMLGEIMMIEDHDQRKRFTKYEYMEELIIRRKVTTLLMAAEFIMENKDFNAFYIAAMKDYKQYSMDEINNKENAIWSYLSENECLDDYS